ncbi:uncharacterized protein A1O9_02889 [Exophiala aquamarina CBS 119918]|uniref:Alpha/beta hydrolase fold-3 domain-containing protein n=1 Tax=Exophiala aquamarina CBS 119918 TaxID=1182545 RepID=A0A072PMN8_9EURO|nr:uncharacterized protein A1O9_02889 [Exophiala aquamarina CBS 119918]KEF61324.1 hypothetical protein A1O9_02889 [Exophiala aquamarina CBS 119918]
MPPSDDVPGMRRWVQELFMSEAYNKEKARFRSKYPQDLKKVNKSIVPVSTPGQKDEAFDIWVYEPFLDEQSSSSELRPAILMFHGGGWIHGNPVGDEVFSELLAALLNSVVIGVDYRLAPEHRFPAPVDDGMRALRWLSDHAPQYRVDITRVGLFGASAGGNIAAACALKSLEVATARDWVLRLVSLVVPVTAHPKAEAIFDKQRETEQSQNEKVFASAPPLPEIVTLELTKLFGKCLYGGEQLDPCDRYASPLASKQVPDHPPTLMTIAGCDFLRPQGLKYAQFLRSSGVQVEEDILPGVPHGFTFALNSELVTSWFERQVEAFRNAFNTC